MWPRLEDSRGSVCLSALACGSATRAGRRSFSVGLGEWNVNRRRWFQGTSTRAHSRSFQPWSIDGAATRGYRAVMACRLLQQSRRQLLGERMARVVRQGGPGASRRPRADLRTGPRTGWRDDLQRVQEVRGRIRRALLRESEHSAENRADQVAGPAPRRRCRRHPAYAGARYLVANWPARWPSRTAALSERNSVRSVESSTRWDSSGTK